MKKFSKNHALCEDVMVEPGRFASRETEPQENESFRMIEIKTMPNGHVTAQAVIVQKSLNS